MANLLSLKRRIRAAGNVSKTTRAMQMIAVSKLKKAQDATLSGRPYVEKLSSIAKSVSDKIENKYIHAYIKKADNAENQKTLVLVFAPDKGLCGGLVTTLAREVIEVDKQNKNNIYLIVGRKIEATMGSLNKELVASFKFGTTLPSFESVSPIIKIINEYFLGKKVTSVKILSTGFTSVFSQKPKITTILPIEFPREEPNSAKFTLFEPNVTELLPPLLNHYLEMTIYQLLLEAFASEQGARMVAMQNATDNALEIVQDLQLEYNKGRQEKITNEILDIGGAAFTFAYE
ncbi:MAG: ATP synthase F1 subunit gamma [Candidatus Levybacteria bacterium]|nr:ATP synthase F1 subunit gamma [Candidatus Levybacteria bacterium]MDZ4228223.1 ATP synthase F1 subunit gamma [Candidatus Levybacteria bacterium]